MAANVAPVYSIAGDLQVLVPIVTAAAVVYDTSGTTGTDVYYCFKADATNGGYLQRIRFKYVANGTTTSVAAVIKLFICNIQTNGTATSNTNMSAYDEIAVPATGVLTTTAVNAFYDVPFGFAFPLGYSVTAKITVSQGANTGWMPCPIAGKY